MKGKLIVIEGIDGSGKSTQIELLKGRLIERGFTPLHIKLPDYNDPSSTLVKMYLAGEFGSKAGDVNAYAASAFFAVDRYASFKRHWGEAYLDGNVVVADRYTTSNAVHQMAKLTRSEWDGFLHWLFEFEYKYLGIPEPCKVVFLDMPVEVSQKLLTGRYNGNDGKKDVHERNIEYLKSCRESALYAAEKWGWAYVPCVEGDRLRGVEEIADLVWREVKPIL